MSVVRGVCVCVCVCVTMCVCVCVCCVCVCVCVVYQYILYVIFSCNYRYLVCTEEGYIHKCSCSYNEQVLETYTGHTVRETFSHTLIA